MNKPSMPGAALPWSKEQFAQMKDMMETTIPMQEDNLRRAKASGLQVDDLMNELARHKQQLGAMIAAWEDKYK